MNKELTIIICTLNGEKTIKNLLDKLQVNTKHYDIIIVDGGSGDKTKEIAQNFSCIKFVTKEGIGLLLQRMYAIEIINTEYFSFIDQDDLIDSGDIVKALEYLKINNLDGVQFKTTSRILNNNYWQKVWAAYFETIYVYNKKINMLGRPCLTKTYYYKELNLKNRHIKIAMEDTYLNKVLINNFGNLNYKVAPYFSYRLCENTFIENWRKWFRYGIGDVQLTENLSSFISSFYHLIFRILLYRSIKTLFSKNILYFPGILLFSTARLSGFLTNLLYHKK